MASPLISLWGRLTTRIKYVYPIRHLTIHNWMEEEMDVSIEVLIGMAAVVIVGLVLFAINGWRQRRRVHRVEEWVKKYLSDRYGVLPSCLRIDCSDDRLWPVLVAFERPPDRSCHNLQFDCHGAATSYSLL